MKIHLVEAELFPADRQTDRQTDMMKLIVAIGNFANAPANSSLCTYWSFLCCSLFTYIRIADEDPRVAK